jgi:hypothetical protein
MLQGEATFECSKPTRTKKVRNVKRRCHIKGKIVRPCELGKDNAIK